MKVGVALLIDCACWKSGVTLAAPDQKVHVQPQGI
jgi:hypothetical protein